VGGGIPERQPMPTSPSHRSAMGPSLSPLKGGEGISLRSGRYLCSMECAVTRPSPELSMPHRVEPHPKRFAIINGKRMAYVELGEGELVFLLQHGNPTSSYLWRNVMPELAGLGRCLAPDLIGMGDSDKLENPGPDTYRFATHRRFLWDFIDAVIEIGRAIAEWAAALPRG
jgi:hypothetical protein